MENKSSKIVLLVAGLLALAFSIIGLYNVSMVTGSYNASDKYVVWFVKCSTIAASLAGLVVIFGSKKQLIASLAYMFIYFIASMIVMKVCMPSFNVLLGSLWLFAITIAIPLVIALLLRFIPVKDFVKLGVASVLIIAIMVIYLR